MSQTDSPGKQGSMEMPENGKIEDYLAVLEEHRKNCEREGNFVEAEMAKNRIEELKLQEGQRQLEALFAKQQEDKLRIEEAHEKEYQEYNAQWDQRMQEKEQESAILISQLEERQNKELEENRAILEQKIPMVFKPSSELLNLKKIQDQLARQKEYGEAHKVQQKIIELEREEQEKYQQVRMKKIVSAEKTLIDKLQNQMNALRKKCEAQINGMRKVRDQEHEKMLQRYQNVKKEHENQQNLERIKLEKLFGKQLLASYSSLSYGQNKDSYKSRQLSPGRKSYQSAGPASRPPQ